MNRIRLAVMACLGVWAGSVEDPARAQDSPNPREAAQLWVALPFPCGQAAYAEALGAVAELLKSHPRIATRISLVAGDPRDLDEARLLPLGRAAQSAGAALEVSLFDAEMVEALSDWGVKSLPVFALVRGRSVHLCSSVKLLKETLECGK